MFVVNWEFSRVLHGDLQLVGRKGLAPLQYNNVYWGRNIFACGPIISSCVISINEMVFSLMRKRNKVRCVASNTRVVFLEAQFGNFIRAMFFIPLLVLNDNSIKKMFHFRRFVFDKSSQVNKVSESKGSKTIELRF